MLCEIGNTIGFLGLWVFFLFFASTLILAFSGFAFYYYYMNPTYETWIYKINPRFPVPLLVKKELKYLLKGLVIVSICPTLTIFLSNIGVFQGYCGDNNKSYLPIWVQIFITVLFTDLYEYFYHSNSHSSSTFWKYHRYHHRFLNPTPFAVLADGYIDQFFRSCILLILPWLFPLNLDIMFIIFGLCFYGYGVYLHTGFELSFLSAHTLVLNTNYQHNKHHSKSNETRSIYPGFLFKIWDNLFDTHDTDEDKCLCFRCRKLRTRAEWEEIPKPDYSVLKSLSWWMMTDSRILGSTPCGKDD